MTPEQIRAQRKRERRATLRNSNLLTGAYASSYRCTAPCAVCGATVSTLEDGSAGVQTRAHTWVCSVACWERLPTWARGGTA